MQRLLTTIVAYRVRILLVLGLLAVAVFGSNAVRAYTPAQAPSAALLTNAVNDYLRATGSPLADQISVQVNATDGAFAKLTVAPNDREMYDSATAFVRRTGNRWEVLTLGTAFLPEDCAALNLPVAIPCE